MQRKPLSLSKNLPAESFDGKESVKGNRHGFHSRSITRRSGQNCKIIVHFYILQFCRQLVKKVQRDFFDKLEAASACSGSRFGSLVAEFVFGSVRFDDIGAVKL